MTTFDLRHEGRTGIEMGLGVGPQKMEGWPYTDFATGWYVIGYSEEIRPGEVKAARWFGRDLAVFRTEAGALAALDAYCPHMGAHLAQPGRFGDGVSGECLQCPWHGWLWDTDGRNAGIPYRPEGPIQVRAGARHVREVDGIIVMWYDHAGGPPTYEWEGLPYIGDKADYYPLDCTVDGPRVTNTMTMIFGAGKEESWLTPTGPVEGYVDNIFWGASLGVARLRIDGMVCIHLPVLTPVDEDHCIFFSTVTATREPGAVDDEPRGRSGKLMKAQHWQIRNDFHIWQHMAYRVKPIYTGTAEQTRYAFIRKHFDQFYPNPVYSRYGQFKRYDSAP